MASQKKRRLRVAILVVAVAVMFGLGFVLYERKGEVVEVSECGTCLALNIGTVSFPTDMRGFPFPWAVELSNNTEPELVVKHRYELDRRMEALSYNNERLRIFADFIIGAAVFPALLLALRLGKRYADSRD